jgi:hypothetical protein
MQYALLMLSAQNNKRKIQYRNKFGFFLDSIVRVCEILAQGFGMHSAVPLWGEHQTAVK